MLNKTIIQGRLTRNAELRYTQSNKSVASFTVAWSENYNGTENKLFLPCVAWGKTGEFINQYFDKGSEILLEGRLQSRRWTDSNGNNREVIELIIDRAHFAGKREAKKEFTPPEQTEAPTTEVEETDFEQTDFEELCDDSELPF